MKLWSKEALVLGGIYSVFNSPFVYGGNTVIEHISALLFLIFITCAIMLCFNKTPKFISYILYKYPKISYYLSAFGWIPYFTIVAVMILFVSSHFVEYNENNIEPWLHAMHYILELGIPVSLIVAYIWQKSTRK